MMNKNVLEQTAQKTDLALVTQEESLPARGTSFTGKGERDFPHHDDFKMEYWYILKNKEPKERTSCIYDSCHNIPLFCDLVEIGQ